VTRLALFGSAARDTATSGSDVDVLVAFDGPATSKRYLGIDDDTLWSIIQDDVPELLTPLKALKNEAQS
jgi:predicted nucleotidyltransferase